MQKRHIAILISIIAASALAHVLVLARINPADFYAAPWYAGEGGDAAEYSAIATHIMRGEGFSLGNASDAIAPTAIRPPLYPYFLAGTYGLFGNEHLGAVRVIQIFFAIGFLALFWLLAWRLTQSAAVSHLAAAALALHPRFILYNLAILTESLFFGLLLVTLLAAVQFYKTRRRWYLVGMFGFLALASLTKPTALYVAPLLAVWIWHVAANHSAKEAAKNLLLGLGVFMLVLSPWLARNYAQFDSIMLTTKSGGGLAEAWDKTILEPLGISNRDILTPHQGLSEQEFSRMGRKIFLSEIWREPLLMTRIAFQKSLYWFSPHIKSSSATVRALHAVGTSAIFILGLLGMRLFWKRRGLTMLLPFLLLMTAFSAIHILTVPYHRYRFPVVDTWSILFAAYAAMELWYRLKSIKFQEANSYVPHTSPSPSSERRG